MSNRELVDVAFLTVVLVVLVGSFVYVNAFYEEAEEEDEEFEEGDVESTGSFYDPVAEAYPSVGAILPELSVCRI